MKRLGAILLVSSTALYAVDMVSWLNKASVVLRNGRTLETSLIEQIKSDPSKVDSKKLFAAWVETPEFYQSMESWHKQIFRTPQLLNSDIEFLDDAPDSLRQSLAQEPVQLALHIIRNNLPYSDLIDGNYAIRNRNLIQFYANEEVSASTGGDWRLVRLSPRESGALTMRSMHLRNPTTLINRWRTHAAQVLEKWACVRFKDIPVGGDEDDITHGLDPKCAGCHKPLDGMGSFFARWERGGFFNAHSSIDDLGTYFETAIHTKRARGLANLGQILTSGPRFAGCMVEKVWHHMTGRELNKKDSTSFTELLQSFWLSGYNLKSLFIAAVNSNAFKNYSSN